MPRPRAFREVRMLNGPSGDPCLFVDDQGRDNLQNGLSRRSAEMRLDTICAPHCRGDQ